MQAISRRDWIKTAGILIPLCATRNRSFSTIYPSTKPNIILCMADDQGWGDTGYNGHPVLKTPNLDRMEKEGIRFDRFYSGAPVCSPTRGSCLTGRHPYRYGIFYANSGYMKKEEITLAEAVKTRGYTTGHFGKWHLGTLTTKIKDSNRGKPGNTKEYSPPWENGFDVCFSTEAKVPTWDPLKDPKTGEFYGTQYWSGPDQLVSDNINGDDSRIIMDRAIPFIQQSAKNQQPFLTVIWFHSPHAPVVAGQKYRAPYKDQDENKQHYYGCITAMDEQIGRLHNELKNLGIDKNTMLWFCSDNGPAGEGGGTKQKPGKRQQGSAGPLRGRKGSLYEGGIRVPGLLVWPEKIQQPRTVSMPCCTSDYYPTILDILNIDIPSQPKPLDGISLLPLIEGKMSKRPSSIGFESNQQQALIGNQYKLYSSNRGKTFELYDLLHDTGEQTDLSTKKPDILQPMKNQLETWRKSCQSSLEGKDY